MSRISRIWAGIASGYVVLAANVAFTLTSLPLALRYLEKAEVGLWALLLQFVNYLALIDLGASGAVARLLIDHKDSPDNGHYGALIKSGGLVLVVQGTVIVAAGVLAGPVAVAWLRVDPELQATFRNLLFWQCLVAALGFSTRILTSILTAHQRTDVVNYCQLGTLTLSLVTLWLGFHFGLGIFSLIWSGFAGACAGAVLQIVACSQLKLLPKAQAWGRVSFAQFREIFVYGSDLFLIAIGTQMVNASQTIIITRSLGLDAVAYWTAGTRVFTLLCQMVWRPMIVSCPTLSEMLVRKENDRVRSRFRQIIVVTAWLATIAAVGLAANNSRFVEIWTEGKILWPASRDVVLGIWLIVLSILHCYNALTVQTKKVEALRYVYFVEGCMFFGLALWATPRFGIIGLLTCSLLCSICCTGIYGAARTASLLQLHAWELITDWCKPVLIGLSVLIPIATITDIMTTGMPNTFRIFGSTTAVVLVGGGLLLTVGLPKPLLQQQLQAMRARFT